MTSKKLRVGPLPEQTDDYSQYEETVIRWDRIGLLGGVALLVVGALGSWVWQGREAPKDTPVLAASSPAATPQQVVGLVDAPEPEPREPPVLQVEALQSLPATAAGKGAAQAADATSEPVEGVVTEPAVERAALHSPVSRLHQGLRRAELTMQMHKGEPGAPSGPRIAMTDAGIIKVILFTEMEGLRGTVLHHDWYRGDKRMARVRIPVNGDLQQSHSSKFINRQMLGDWRVTVSDEQGQLYAEANFEVVDG